VRRLPVGATSGRSVDVSFLTPLAGATGLVVLVAALAALARERRASRLRDAVGLRGPGPLARLPSLLGLLAVGLLALAAAQPVVHQAETRRARSDAEVVFLFDRSRSMLAGAAPDAPARFARAVALSLEMRAALADVPSGAASIGEETLPHLFPTSDRPAFDLVVRSALGVDRPPPVGERDLLATDLEEIGDVATDGYFSPDARRRLAIVLTDGESEPFSATDVAEDLHENDVALVVVRLGNVRERIYGDAGALDAYRPGERAAVDLGRLASESGGRVYGETETDAAVRGARRLLGIGPTAPVGEEERRVALAPYVVAAAIGLLAAMFLSMRPSGLRP
jgi:hypothetical protein